MTDPCNCGWLSLHLNEPHSAVRFDETLQAFVIDDLSGGGRGGAVMHFCPGCGGKLPDASKPVWFPIAPPGERERLQALTNGLASADQILSRLGKPDYDEFACTFREENGRMIRDETIPPIRNIEYYKLSEWFNLEFYITHDGGLRTRIQIKSLPPRHIEPA